MRKVRLLLLFSSLILIVAFASLAFYYGFIIIRIEEIGMELVTGNRIGFNTNREALNFGTVYPGSESRRKLLITNNNDFPVEVIIENSGNLSPWVSVERNSFIVYPEEETGVWYTVSAPRDAPYSAFSGQTRVVFRRKFL